MVKDWYVRWTDAIPKQIANDAQKWGGSFKKKSEKAGGKGKRFNIGVARIQRGLHALLKGFLSSDKQSAFCFKVTAVKYLEQGLDEKRWVFWKDYHSASEKIGVH